MSIDFAALILAVLGPLLTGYFLYLRGNKVAKGLHMLKLNDLPHLDRRLEQIEERLARVEGWMFEHQRNHAH